MGFYGISKRVTETVYAVMVFVGSESCLDTLHVAG